MTTELRLHLLKNISDCIPKNVPVDLNTSIHVTGFFSLWGKKGGGEFLRAKACRAYLASNVILFYLAQAPPTPLPFLLIQLALTFAQATLA